MEVLWATSASVLPVRSKGATSASLVPLPSKGVAELIRSVVAKSSAKGGAQLTRRNSSGDSIIKGRAGFGRNRPAASGTPGPGSGPNEGSASSKQWLSTDSRKGFASRARAGAEELRRHTAALRGLQKVASTVERAFQPARTLRGLLHRYSTYERRWAGPWHGGRPGVHPVMGAGTQEGEPRVPPVLGAGTNAEKVPPGMSQGGPQGVPQGVYDGEWSMGNATELVQQVFGRGIRYYWAIGSGDKCAGEFHFTDSLKCVVAEARYLNRTFVLDPEVCLHPDHNGHRWLVNPLAAYYDLPSFLA